MVVWQSQATFVNLFTSHYDFQTMKIALYSLLMALAMAVTLPSEARPRDSRGQKMTVYDASVVDVQPTFPQGWRMRFNYP